jgi:hypothetical protein
VYQVYSESELFGRAQEERIAAIRDKIELYATTLVGVRGLVRSRFIEWLRFEDQEGRGGFWST